MSTLSILKVEAERTGVQDEPELYTETMCQRKQQQQKPKPSTKIYDKQKNEKILSGFLYIILKSLC